MTTKTKKLKDREGLAALILQEAEQMFIAEGYAATSLRKIAKRINYSPGTIYLHFESKDELFYAVQAKAFKHFLSYMQPLESISNPLKRLREMGERYLSFALKNPEYYDLMFIHNAPMNALKKTEGWELGIRTFDLLEHTVKECMEQDFFTPADSETTAFMIWSTVHGMCSLYIRERLKRHLPTKNVRLMIDAQRLVVDRLILNYSSSTKTDSSTE